MKHLRIALALAAVALPACKQRQDEGAAALTAEGPAPRATCAPCQVDRKESDDLEVVTYRPCWRIDVYYGHASIASDESLTCSSKEEGLSAAKQLCERWKQQGYTQPCKRYVYFREAYTEEWAWRHRDPYMGPRDGVPGWTRAEVVTN